MKFKLDYTAIGLLIVTMPLFLLALKIKETRERFAASQGGAQQQLAAGRVLSEDQVREYSEANKRQVVADILNLTEPEGRPGPQPAGQIYKMRGN
jgi:hypothetical protein